MLWLFRRIFDPNAAREEAEELRRQREDWPPGFNPDDAGVEVPSPSSDAQPVAMRCRVCGFEAPSTGLGERYCSTCLAETMEPVKRS